MIEFLRINYLVLIHKFILSPNSVSNAEMSNFSQGQGNQGITRPALGREQVIPQIDPREIGSAFHRAGAEIAEKSHFWMGTSWFRGQARRHAQRPGEQRAPGMANTIRMSDRVYDKFGWTRGRRRVLRRSRIPDPVSPNVLF